jgi:DNA-binding NtrC family response regulator
MTLTPMVDRRLQWIPLFTAHELRRDFRDVIAGAASLDAATNGLLASIRWHDVHFDALWSWHRPDVCGSVDEHIRRAMPRTRAVVAISRTALNEVTNEVPSHDPLGANLRRLSRGEPLAILDCLLLALDDGRRAALGWVGDWRDTRPLLEHLARLSEETLPILVRGETGTGKEMIARGLHIFGRRRHKPYLAVNCAELPETILESELFGHSRGAFTGAVADRIGLFEAAADGTVFLDEIGELPLAAQAKLLRVLEDHCVRRVGSSQPRPLFCRIVAATNRDLVAQMRERRFRADLYYRLRGSELVLRPLRERRGDLLAVAEVFAARAALRFRRRPVVLAPDARLALASHPWPGNLRELRQTIESAVLASATESLEATHLGICSASTEPPQPKEEPLLTARAVERAHIVRALASTAGNKMAAARLLGLSRQSLQRRMIRHGISSPAENGRSRPDVPSACDMRGTPSAGTPKFNG